MDSLSAQIGQYKSIEAVFLAKKNQLTSEIRKQEERLAQLQAEQKTLQDNIGELKVDKETLRQSIAQASTELEEIQQSQKFLMSSDSAAKPKQIELLLEEKQKQIDELKKRLADFETPTLPRFVPSSLAKNK